MGLALTTLLFHTPTGSGVRRSTSCTIYSRREPHGVLGPALAQEFLAMDPRVHRRLGTGTTGDFVCHRASPQPSSAVCSQGPHALSWRGARLHLAGASPIWRCPVPVRLNAKQA